MKKLILSIVLTLFFTLNSFSQHTQSCLYLGSYIKIEGATNIPIITENSDNTITLTHNEQYITDIFAKYKIYNLKKAFPGATSELLKKTYLISYDSKDLINELYDKVPNTIFSFDKKFSGITIDQNDIDFFNGKIFNLDKYISTHDGLQCTHNCDLINVPSNFSLSVSFTFDFEKQLLMMKSHETTSCGNSFSFGFKKKIINSGNKLILWEATSENGCFDWNQNEACRVENTFFATIRGTFDLSIEVIEGSFILKKENAIFGENVFRFNQKTASLEDEFAKATNIFPNPIKNRVSVSNSLFTIDNVSLWDISGKEIKTIRKDFNHINVSNISSGIYFLKIRSGQKVVNKKIIITN